MSILGPETVKVVFTADIVEIRSQQWRAGHLDSLTTWHAATLQSTTLVKKIVWLTLARAKNVLFLQLGE